MQPMPITTASRPNREPTASEIRAVRDFVRKHGGLKKIESQVVAMSALIGLPPPGFEGRYMEGLKASLNQLLAMTAYAQANGGFKRLETELARFVELVTLTGGNIDKTRQAIEFLKEK